MAGFYTVDGRWLATEGGRPMVGAKLFTRVAGTTALATTYKNTALSVPNTNPVIMDSQGRAVVILDPAVTYDFELQRADGSQAFTQNAVSLPASATSLNAVQAGLSAEITNRTNADTVLSNARVSGDNNLQNQVDAITSRPIGTWINATPQNFPNGPMMSGMTNWQGSTGMISGGAFIAPSAGFYVFSGTVVHSGGTFESAMFKNGAVITGSVVVNGTYPSGQYTTPFVQYHLLASGDSVVIKNGATHSSTLNVLIFLSVAKVS
jgi:hypothetical protein